MEAKGLEEYLEGILSLTGNAEWDILVKELTNEIYQHQANVLDNAKNWDEVVYTKGYCAALAYIINLRDRTKNIQDNLKEANNADV